MTLDETIKEFTDWAKGNRKEQNFWAAERDENDETNPLSYADCEGLARDAETRVGYHEQLAEWLTELKDLREENKVLTRDCLRLIKANGKLRKKLGQIAKYKRLLKAAVEDLKFESQCRNCKYQQTGLDNICYGCRGDKYEWRYADEALKLLNDEK